jgi:PAS domain S-box-containing protein
MIDLRYLRKATIKKFQVGFWLLRIREAKTHKKRKLDELLVRDAQYRSIFENAPFGIVLADTAGLPREYNPAFVRIFGYSDDEFRSMRVHDFAHPDDVADTERMIRGLVEGELENAQSEVRFVRKDGSVVWVLIVASTIRQADGELVLSIAMFEDITRRKDAEEAAVAATTGRKVAEQATVAATDWADELIENLDAIVVGLDADGNIDTFNRAAKEITGYAREELEGRNWFEVLVPRDRYPLVWETFELLPPGGLPRRFENPILTKAGEERYIVWRTSERGAIAGTISIGVDITESKRLEEALRESEERFRTLVENAPEAILVFDAALDRFISANANAAHLFGCSPEELQQTEPRRFYAPNQPDGRPAEETFPEHSERALAGEIVVFERIIRDALGEIHVCEVRLVRLPAADQRLIRASFIDISERKRSEDERALLQAEFLQAQKMEAVGRLAGGVAHNFNNLLTAISGYSELALAQLPEASDVRTDVEEIKRATERAAAVVQGLLRFSRRDREQCGNLDLNEVVLDMEVLLRQLIPSSVEIVHLLAPDLRQVAADRSQFEQILANLALNASDAMPKGGKLTIETANPDLAEPLRKPHVSVAPGRYVTLAVRDTGIGMDEQTLARVFEPFFTTKGPKGGTGLGLSTVFGIVDEAGGQVLVDSRPNEGTTFTIYLPATDRRTESRETP